MLAALLSLGTAPSQAQVSPAIDAGNPNVSIDFSVLEDGGIGRPVPGAALPSAGGHRLLMPGAAAPKSKLYFRPKSSNVRLSKPKAQAKRKTVAAPMTKAAPKAAPKPMASSKPAPPPPAMKKPSVSAAPPPPAPKPTAKPKAVAKAAPPLPPAAKYTAPPPAPAPMAKKPKPAPVKATPKAAPKPAPEPVKTVSTPVPPPPPPAAKKSGRQKVVTAIPPKPAPAPEPQKSSLPPAGEKLAIGQQIRLVFEESESKLPGSKKNDLKTLAGKLKDQSNLRLQLMAYAGGEKLSASRARRLSLSRALSVRSFLIESGVRSTRIDVRALGNKTTEKPVNRVDLNLVER